MFWYPSAPLREKGGIGRLRALESRCVYNIDI